MDLRWLSAPEDEVASAKANLKKDSGHRIVPRKRSAIVHVNHALMLWYLCLVWMTLGVRVDTGQDGRIEAQDVRDIVVTMGIFVLWVCGTARAVPMGGQPTVAPGPDEDLAAGSHCPGQWLRTRAVGSGEVRVPDHR